MQRLRDKNSSDWNYWRKQQSDLYAQLRQHNNIKESILYKFDRLQKQVKKMFYLQKILLHFPTIVKDKKKLVYF